MFYLGILDAYAISHHNRTLLSEINETFLAQTMMGKVFENAANITNIIQMPESSFKTILRRIHNTYHYMFQLS